MLRSTAALMLLVAASVAGECLGQTRYQVTWLGKIGREPPTVAPEAMNNLGQIVGSFRTTTGDLQAFLWEEGMYHDLGPLGPSLKGSRATDINDLGQIIGREDELPVALPYVWTRATGWTPIGRFPVPPNYPAIGGHVHQPFGINNRGQITGNLGGYSSARLDLHYAWLYDSGQWTNLGGLPYSLGVAAFVRDINDLGQIIGQSRSDVTGEIHVPPFFWDNGQMVELSPPPGATSASVNQINNQSIIVGVSRGPTAWYDLVPTLLPVLPGDIGGVAEGINDFNQIVGNSAHRDEQQDPPVTVSNAVIWENGVVYNLNDLTDLSLGGRLVRAIDINERGQIMGVGYGPSGLTEPYLLTPIPEPATGVLVVCGVLVPLFLRTTICVTRRRS